MRTITGVAWFENVGIVTTISTPMNEERAYIGIAKGIDEIYDMEFIAYWGIPFSLEAAKIVIKEKGFVKKHILKVDRKLEL